MRSRFGGRVFIDGDMLTAGGSAPALGWLAAAVTATASQPHLFEAQSSAGPYALTRSAVQSVQP